MPDDMRAAFEKAGFKTREKTPPPRSQTPDPPARKFVLQDNYASQAEQVITGLKQDRSFDYRNFTTSKIRNILAMVSEIYNDVLMEKGDTLSRDLQGRIEYMKVRLVYECGREPKIVLPFVNKAGLLELLGDIGDSRQKFIDFARYMEALVAYHRFHGGKDN